MFVGRKQELDLLQQEIAQDRHAILVYSLEKGKLIEACLRGFF